MKIIIPMAGLGTRFQKVADHNPEYAKPKPFILVKGHPMVKWATASLPFNNYKNKNTEKKFDSKDKIFIILKEHDDKHNIEVGLKKIYSNQIKIIKLPKVTRGAAETAYQAKEFIDPDEELIITDSDHHFDGEYFETVIRNKASNIAGIIPVFRARNDGIPKWSYSLIDDDNMIIKTAEKDRELMEAGAYANIGSYYFSKAKYFFELAEEIIRENRLSGAPEKAEFYIAPLYQTMIERNMKVKAAVIPQVWGLGTPEDLEYFLKQNIELHNE